MIEGKLRCCVSPPPRSPVLFGDEHKICLLYLVLPIAVPRSYRLVPLPDFQAVIVGFSDLGELLEEYLRPLLLVVGPLRFALEKKTSRAV